MATCRPMGSFRVPRYDLERCLNRGDGLKAAGPTEVGQYARREGRFTTQYDPHG